MQSIYVRPRTNRRYGGGGARKTIDLSRLNPREHALLAMLANGHMVKSAAALIGSTENAVNERLWQARRKGGRFRNFVGKESGVAATPAILNFEVKQ